MPQTENRIAPVNRKALAMIFATVFLDLLGAGILVPVTPYLVQQFRGDALTVGLVALSFSAAQFAAAPVLGVLSDRFGRRPVLLISLLGSAFGYFLFGWATALWVLFVARVIDGVTGGNIATAQAYIADVTPPEDRAKNFGLIGAAFGLGFIAGPALGGALSHLSLQAPAYAAGLLSLATCAGVFFFLPESLPLEKRRKEPFGVIEINPTRQIRRSLERPALRGLLLAVFAHQFAFAALQTNFAVYTAKRFGLGPAENAWLFAFVGVMSVLTQGVAIRRMSGRIPDAVLIRWGLATSAAGFVMVALAWRVGWLYPALGVICFGSGIAGPTLVGLASQRVAGFEQGMLLGATQSLRSLTLILGPVWAGAVFDWIHPAAPYWSAAAWIGAAWLLAGRGLRREPGVNQSPRAS